jgi:RNA polymerase sigma factor (sigma-70 family)
MRAPEDAPTPQPLLSEQMLVLLHARDQAAFTELVENHDADLVRLCFVVCGDIDMSRDATQNTWHHLWSRPPRLRDASKLRHWLLAVAANEARQLAPRRRTGRLREHHRLKADGPRASESSLDLARVLDRLDSGDRGLLALRYMLELSSDEIGAVLGFSAEGARSRLHRLLARIRKDLQDE